MCPIKNNDFNKEEKNCLFVYFKDHLLSMKRAMIMTSSESHAYSKHSYYYFRKKMLYYIYEIYRQKWSKNMCQKNFFRRRRSHTATSLTHSFSLIFYVFLFLSMLLLCYLWVFRLSFVSHAEHCCCSNYDEC